MQTRTASNDPLAVLESLTVADLEARLRETLAQEKALRTLLRSVRARERVRQRKIGGTK
jgi:hypothetical protein